MSVEPISLWDTMAEEAPPAKPRLMNLETDVAIVGGGFTGLSAALHLAERGVACHVLEANDIGFGGSGRNVGLVNPGSWLPPQDVRRALGGERGEAFVALFGRAPSYVFSLIEQHQIRCDATRTGTIHVARSRAGLRELEDRHAEWRRLGAPVHLLSADHVARKTGTGAFLGGLLDERAGTINPMGYSRGLARAAQAAGAEIRTGTPVRSIARENGAWRLETGSGHVVAQSVVLATNAYTDNLWPGLARTYTMIHFFQIATEPLGARIDGILPEGQGLWDTGKVMLSLRRDAAGRLIVGSMGMLIGGDRGLTRYWASKTLKRLFPGLGEVRWEEAWHGKIAMTPDHLPRIYNPEPGVYIPIGYNGRGITTGTVFGKAIAERLSGGADDDLPLPISPVRPVTTRRMAGFLYESAFKAYRLYDSIL